MLTALLIMIREGFEAALIVAIVYAYLRRIRRTDLDRAMWQGVLAAAAISVLAGVVIHLTAGSLEGAARLRAFAAISLTAVAVLTWMIFWMRRQARAIKGDLQHKIDYALGAGNVRVAVMAVAFFAVLREGLEAALFLIAVATGDSGWQVLVGGTLGLAIAAALGWMVAVGGRRLPMQQFFKVTGMVLIVFAAGLLARSVLFLQGAGDLGSVWNDVYDLRAAAWLTQSTETGKFLAAMFGWDPRPSIEQVLAWAAYLTVVSWLFLRPSRAPAPASAPTSAPAPAPSGPGS
ncbi:MAG TPA: FTR1 family protein [Mycobacteriales bacterium]|nr:FTR1 family protein [Mycobacteriales bacterium]